MSAIVTREMLEAKGCDEQHLRLFDFYDVMHEAPFALRDLLYLVEDYRGGVFHEWLCDEFVDMPGNEVGQVLT